MGKSDSHIVLYRKYRSRSFNEVVGQDHIVKPLREAIKQGKVAHAYLFTGPRGVGKTSIARIFAFEINGLKYQDQLPIDIIEIDGASNRRIDEVRELKERIHVAPVQAKYKVYIIDEVHMLTKEAFNALLKTLEEPPAHVVFILATTEVQKLPATIISRTQRYSFKPASKQAIADHLATIASAEKTEFDQKALDLIADMAQGSFRDAISLLDQVSSSGNVDLENVEASLGVANETQIDELIDAVSSASQKEVVTKLQSLIMSGSSSSQIAAQIIHHLREKQVSSSEWFDLIDNLLNVGASLQPEISLELALLRANIELSGKQEQPTKPAPNKVQASEPAKVETKKPAPKPQPEPKTPPQPEVKTEVATKPPQSKKTLDQDTWNEILNVTKKDKSALYSVLRMSEPKFSGDELELVFKFEFHQKQISSTKNMEILKSVIEQVTGQNIAVTTSVSKEVKEPKPAEFREKIEDEKKDSGPADNIIQTFGGGEVVKI